MQVSEPSEHKKCCTCKKLLAVTDFYQNRFRSDGLAITCKVCQKEHTSRRAKERVADGLCRICNAPKLSSHNRLCEYHCIADAARTALGTCDRKTIVALIEKLKRQNYCCPYTRDTLSFGVNMQLDHIKPRSRFPELANSLDNVEWVSKRANLAKGDMTKEEFIDFCRLIIDCT